MEILIDNALNSQRCNVCLSSDRTLTPLGKYLDLFTKICTKLKSAYKTKDLLLCWECHMVLQKVEKFQQKALKAQRFLKNLGKSLEGPTQHHNLSTLQTVLNTEINYYFLARETIEPGETIVCDTIKIERDEDSKYTNQLYNQNIFCDDKDGNDIKDEKIDINQDILNNLFNIEVTDFKREIDDDSREFDDFLYIDTVPKKKKRVKKKVDNHRRYCQYKVVYNSRDGVKKVSEYTSNLTNLVYDKVLIDKEELMLLREQERTKKHYTKMEFKCELCILGFANKSTYSSHMNNHNKTNSEYECGICHQRFATNQYLSLHSSTHMFKYQCQLCDATYLSKQWMLDHIKNTHDRAYQCVDCGQQFRTRRDVLSHVKSHVEFICDHCGKRALKKHLLEKHMRVAHLPHICKICNITFKKHRIHMNHIKEKHVKTRTEEAFCVECNMQFDNVITYKRHLNTSVKHKPKSNVRYPCPECNKLFNKKMNMKYHYNYFHTDRTNFYCESCAKYFLNNYQLRRHKAVFHDKIKPPKNKFCPHCGRGFAERRILNNHIRTHTGERPFVCTLCAAAFTQAYPLTTHMRAVHKLGKTTAK